MDYPKISIVTPVFNQIQYLEETIQSILSQGYPNLEYIIIDGGSTDGTVDVIKKYESQLAYWISEPDKGMYDALQKGFDHSTGEIMGWLNADDFYLKGSLKLVANVFMKYPYINWVTGSTATSNAAGIIVESGTSRKFNKYQFLQGDYQWISQAATFWRRNLWEMAGGRLRTDLHSAGDFELWLRFIQQDTLYYMECPTGVFRRREGQLSEQLDKYFQEVDLVYSELKISNEDQAIINAHLRKKKIAEILYKTKVLNGTGLVKMDSFAKKHFFVPHTLKWINEEEGFVFDED